MKMKLTKKQIKLLLYSVGNYLYFVYRNGSFDSVNLFVDLLHLKQKIEKEVNLNAKKIK